MGRNGAVPAVSGLDALSRLLVNDQWVRPLGGSGAAGTGGRTCGLWLLAGAPGGCALMRLDAGERRVRDWELFVCPDVRRMACADDQPNHPCQTVLRAVVRHIDAAVRHARIDALAIVAPGAVACQVQAQLAGASRAVLRQVVPETVCLWAANDVESWLFGRPGSSWVPGAVSASRAAARR